MSFERIKVRLDALGEIVGGATPSTKNSAFWDGEIPWLSPKDLATNKERFVVGGERNITQAGLDSCSARMLPEGTILFSSRAPIGYIAIAASPMCTNQGFKSLIPYEMSDSLFLYYLLQANRDVIAAQGSGTTFKEVSGKTMRQIQVEVPKALNERRAIANVLGCIDDKIELNNRINDYLEQCGEALFARYCSLINQSCKLSDLLSLGNGFAFKSDTYVPDGRYKVLTIKNVQDGNVDCTESNLVEKVPEKVKSHCLLNRGDVVLSLTGNVGRVGIVAEEDCLLNQRVAVLLPKETSTLPALYFLFRHPSFQNRMIGIAKGTAQANLSPIETLRLDIPYESKAFMKLAHDCTSIFAAILANKQESKNLVALRDALLPKLMSGEIDVSQVDLTPLNNHLCDC